MNLSSLNKKPLKDIAEDEHESAGQFLKSMDKFDDLCSDQSKLYSGFDLPFSKSELNKEVIEAILISTLFSDTTKLYSNSSFGSYQKTDEYYSDEIDELLSYYDVIDDKKTLKVVTAGTFSFTEEEANFLNQNFLPLFESERLTLSSNRNLLTAVEDENEPSFYTVPTERDRTNGIWRAPLTRQSQTSIPITYFAETKEH